MPKRKSISRSVAKAGKKVLATDTAQGVVGAVADKMQEIAVEKADDAAEAVKEKAAKAGGRRPPSGRSPRRTGARKPGTRKKSTRKTGARKTSASVHGRQVSRPPF